MKKLLLLTIAFATSLFAQADNTLYYGSYDGSGTVAGTGTQKAETYDIAFHVQSDDLAGMEVHGLRIPVNTAATGATNYQAWLSTELALESNKIVADVASVSFTPDASWVDVIFEAPYTIPEEGFYAGYSFTIPSVDTSNNSDPNKSPMMCLASADHDGWFIHCSRSFRKWCTFEASVTFSRFTPAMCIILGGEGMKATAATLRSPADVDAYSLVGKKKTLSFTLVNHGTEDIKNVEYELSVNGQTIQQTTRLASPLKGTYYGKEAALRIAIPAIEEPGSYSVTLRIAKINGLDNQDPRPATTLDYTVIEQMPVHKPLMEEYTGGWCQYCTRGWIALETMTELHGDNFVAVAYHNGDAMQVVSTPNNPSGYPHAYIDRVVDTDPFFGTSGSSLGIQNDWKKRQAIISPADLQLSAQWADAEWKTIHVTTNVKFIRNIADNPYRLSYVLVADDLQCPADASSSVRRSWAQQNAYAGKNDPDKYLGQLSKYPGVITDMHYNDVAIQTSGASGAVIDESLPATIRGAVANEHTYTFDVTQNSLIQNPSKLRVVAILVDTRTGEVVNAEKANVDMPTGFLPTLADELDATIHYTDLTGRKATRQQGILIRTETRSDGSRRSTKIIRK